MSGLTLRKIKNTSFPSLYRRFLLDDGLSNDDYRRMLSLAIIFINSENIFVQQLGYRIIVIYGNRTKDYLPLYEIAVNKGLYPIVKFIDNQHIAADKRNFFTEINSAFAESYKENGVYQSEQQYRLNHFYHSKGDDSISVIAPTSYGKTELILSTIREKANKNICILTPTKALLAQTRWRILKAKIDWVEKIVVHPEMYNESDPSCLAVLTQERLLRLLKDNPKLSFDYVIVDEAHDLLGSDQREELLASAVIILNKRNPVTAFKFLTPFLKQSKNLKVRYTAYDLSQYVIEEHIKTERLYLYDTMHKDGLLMYDQYMNEWYECASNPKDLTAIQFILKYSADKNIIYFNKPSDIESFAIEMVEGLPDTTITPELEEAIQNISEYISPEYTLVKCLKKGIIYHHGAVPDSIRSYIEHLYTVCQEIKFVITSSTLLEGVNIPATRMFLMDNRKGIGNLSASNFRNLIGRVCRFSEVFNPETGSMDKLEPAVFFVRGKYYRCDTNLRDYIPSVMRVDKDIVDSVKNVLLENTVIDQNNASDLSQAREFIENYEEGTLENYTERHAHTKVGKACILNNIFEIDVFVYEQILEQRLAQIKEQHGLITNSGMLISVIRACFLPFVEQTRENVNLLRFTNTAAANYYRMFLSWKLQSYPYKQMVSHTLGYWKSLIIDQKDTVVFVGRWGDISRGLSPAKLWTDVSTKNHAQLVNLAIVRIKEEQDFIDNTLMKFVEVLNDLQMIEPTLYLELKYGTSKLEEIVLIRNGISLSLAKLLMEKYSTLVSINIQSDKILFSPELIGHMKNQAENHILIHEALTNIFP